MSVLTEGPSAAEPGHAKRLDRRRLMWLADVLAVALAVSLPWSTSATGILAGLWLLALVPTLDVAGVRRELATPAGGLPVLLWTLGLIGMLWAFDVPLKERLDGFSAYHKLLVIPLLMAQFRRSERASWAMGGFVLSCCALLAVSCLSMMLPHVPWRMKAPGIPVKDYISQGSVFAACVFFILAFALRALLQRRLATAAGLVALIAVFLIDIEIAVNSRTVLAVIPVLFVLFAFKHLPWKSAAALTATAVVVGGLALSHATNVRSNFSEAVNEALHFDPKGAATRVGERLVYWTKSVGFVLEAPLIGHGTGSVRSLFRRAVEGQAGMRSEVTPNPHNQTLAVAVQLGAVGTVALFAMWMAHLWLFRGAGLAAWAGLVVVSGNLVGSLFNSHLFDFTQGWGYALGMGIAAGAVMRQQTAGGSATPC